MHPDHGLFQAILEHWTSPSQVAPGKAPVTLLDDQGPRPFGGADLLALAGRYAAALEGLGVEPGDRVGLALPTGEDFLGAFFGAWTLGAAAVPLAPLSPRQDAAHEIVRLARPLAAVGARVAVVTPDAVEGLREQGISAVASSPDSWGRRDAGAPRRLEGGPLLVGEAGRVVEAGRIALKSQGSEIFQGSEISKGSAPPQGSETAQGSDPPQGSETSQATEKAQSSEFRAVGSVAPGSAGVPPASRSNANSGDLAIVQFSSGSTGHPKGVRLTHANLLANIQAISEVIRPDPADVGVAWLPLHHDMGLIGCLLWTQYNGIPLVLLPPEFFIRMPARWPAAMSQYRATMTSAPNFAYQLCASLPDSHTQGLDLSAMRAALVGAEPVRTRALQAFSARFAGCGFDPRAFVPTYGLAEATLAVTMTPPGLGVRTDRIDARLYESDHQAAQVGTDEESGRDIVGVGVPMPGLTVSIRHEETGEPLGEREVGEICVEGPSVMGGYHADPEASAAALRAGHRYTDRQVAGHLRTGDLGYLAAGELYVAGRLKDLIIKGGYKYHPQDLEAVAEEHEAVRIGGSSAFLVPRAGDREERLVLVAEVGAAAVKGAAAGGGSPGALSQEIRRRILEAAGIRVDEVVLVVPQQLPRTTSGKIRRAEARKRFLAGQLRAHDASSRD